MDTFNHLFINHPQSVGENYFTHFIQATWFGTKLIAYGVAEYIHALIPGIDLFHLFETESTIELTRLIRDLQNRKEKNE